MNYNYDNTVSIDILIIIDNGVNIAAVGPSIINEVSYVVHKMTGAEVRNVSVYIDSINVD